MKAILYSIVGLASAFNQPDPYRQVHQTAKEVPSDLRFPKELAEPISSSPSNFLERVFEEVDPQDVLPPPPTQKQAETIATTGRRVSLMCVYICVSEADVVVVCCLFLQNYIPTDTIALHPQ